MKKKHILTMLITLPLLLTSCDSFGHEHEWTSYYNNGDGTHTRMCILDSRHTETDEHHFAESITVQPTDTKPGELVKKCQDCGYEETIHLPPIGSHVYDQKVASNEYLFEKCSDYSSIYYKSSIDGAYGDLNSLFETSELPEGYSNIEYLQSSEDDFIDTGIEKNDSTSISYNKCKGRNGRLPGGYQEVEYIEFTGEQSINTKIDFNATWKMSIHWNESSERQLMGYGGLGDEYFGVNDNKYEIGWISDVETGDIDDIVFDYEHKDTAGVYVNGIKTVGSTMGIEVKGSPFIIGAISMGFNCSMKLYSFYCYVEGQLIHQFVPSYEIDSNKIGLFDIFSEEFYTDEGLLAGPNVSNAKLPSEYQEVEFLESHGSQHVNTGIPLQTGNTYDIKYSYLALTNDNEMLGSQGDDTHPHGILISYLNEQQRTVVGPLPGSCTVTTAPEIGAIYESKFVFGSNNYEHYINGELKQKDTVEGLDGGYPLGLFARFGGVLYGCTSVGRVYKYSVSNSKGKVLDFVPCYRKSDNKPGFYNLVDSSFITNSGSGDFDVGPVVDDIKKSTKFDISRLEEETSENIKIGYYYNGNKPAPYFAKIYDVFIYEDGELIQKLIPALKNSDSKVGMYDLIGNKFYEQTGSFKNSGIIGHILDKGVVVKEAAKEEEGKLCYTCSICGAKIYEPIPRLAYKVNFTFDEGVKEIHIMTDNNPNNYVVSTQVYTRNPYSFNYSIQLASVWFKVVLKDGYEFDKVDGSFGKYLYLYQNDFHYLTMIQQDIEVKIISKQIK